MGSACSKKDERTFSPKASHEKVNCNLFKNILIKFVY